MNPPKPLVGTPPLVPDFWSLFVQAVLELTAAAYQELKPTKVSSEWPEDNFSLQLYELLKEPAKLHPLHLVVRHPHPVRTPAMLTNDQSLKESAEIDISLHGTWQGYDYDRIYFAWEAKLLVDHAHRDKPEHERLKREYITKGIFRFIDGKYAADVGEAGMLGYILYGEASSIVDELNSTMLRSHAVPGSPASTPSRALTVADNLQPAVPIGSFSDIYVSHHDRASGRQIKLYHLLLTFDFT